jgi:hypothetical protein
LEDFRFQKQILRYRPKQRQQLGCPLKDDWTIQHFYVLNYYAFNVLTQLFFVVIPEYLLGFPLQFVCIFGGILLHQWFPDEFFTHKRNGQQTSVQMAWHLCGACLSICEVSTSHNKEK